MGRTGEKEKEVVFNSPIPRFPDSSSDSSPILRLSGSPILVCQYTPGGNLL